MVMNLQQKSLINSDEDKEKAGYKIFTKILVHSPSKKLKHHIIMLDNGADVSVIHLPLLHQLIGKQETNRQIQESTISHVGGFTGGLLQVQGEIKLWCNWHRKHPKVPIIFYIIKDPPYYPFVFGSDNMRIVHMSIGYSPDPTVQIKVPVSYTIPIRYCRTEDLNKAYGRIKLGPLELKMCKVQLQSIHTLNKMLPVLITNDQDDTINTFPTKNEIQDSVLQVLIENRSTKSIDQDMEFECEQITSNYQLINPDDPHVEKLMIINNVRPFTKSDIPTRRYLKLREKLPEVQTEMHPQLLQCNLIHQTSQDAEQSALLIKDQEQEEENNNDQDEQVFKKEKLPDLNKLDATSFTEIDESLYKPLPAKDRLFGHYIQEYTPVEEILKLETHPKPVRPYLKEMFLKKYPELPSRSPYDIGNSSLTMGEYRIELQEGVVLPKFKKMYYVSGIDLAAQNDILQFLLRYGIIERSTHHDRISEFASPAYLVPKGNKQAPARLIIDYKILNDNLVSNTPVLPDPQTVLHSLSGCAMFSGTDLSSAYYSLTLAPECRYLTKFATCSGHFVSRRLMMGLSSSPALFADVGYRMLHYNVVRDDQGEIIFDAPNVARLEYDPLDNVHLYYDDVIMGTPPQRTYAETLRVHFELVDKVLSRLHTHKAKISLEKSEFAKTKILFLGWYISHNKISVDPKRITNLLEAPMFNSKKGARSWLGLLNTIKSLLPADFTREISILSPLTSSSKEFKLENIHYETVEKLKRKLATTPLFTNMVDPQAPKYLWTDSAVGQHAYEGAVLTQVKKYKKEAPYLPEYLDLNNPVDRYIYDNQLDYEPARLWIDGKVNDKISVRFKKEDYLTHPFLGYTPEQFQNSLFICIQSIQKEYNCVVTDMEELRKNCVKDLKSRITGLQMRNFSFENDYDAYRQFLDDLLHSKASLDKNLHILETIHRVIRRTTVFIYAEDVVPKKISYGVNYTNPEFVFGLHHTPEGIAFRPYFIKRYKNFDLRKLKNNLQIVGFFSKPVSKCDMNKTAKELEVNALLDSLEHFRKLIGGAEITALVDNQSMVLIHSTKARRMYPKIERWSQLLLYEWPHLKLQQISTEKNISDFMTRDWTIKTDDLKRIPIKYFDTSGFAKRMENRIFTMKEFYQFVQDNEDELLQIHDPKKLTTTVNAISRIAKDVEPIVRPLTVLQQRMSHDNIQIEQQIHMDQVYNLCLASPGFIYQQDQRKYIVEHGLIYVELAEGKRKLCLPQSLEYLFISYYHCASSHGGYKKLMAMLEAYDIPLLPTKLKRFLRACYTCFITNANTYSHKLGSYPLPMYPMSTLQFDLAENLPKSAVYEHILIGVCAMSNYIIAYPLKRKTSAETAFVFANAIYPHFSPKTVITDGGPAFAGDFSELLGTLNIRKPIIGRYHPKANGRCEKVVDLIKTALRKILLQDPSYRWHNKLFLITKMLNAQIQPKTGFSALQLVYGTGPNTQTLFEIQKISEENLPTNVKTVYLEQAKIIKESLEKARVNILDQDEANKAHVNKNKCAPLFKVGEFAFVKDRSIVLGVNTSLRPKFSTDIWVVLKVSHSTAVLSRLADGIQNVFSKEDIKLYRSHEPNSHIPDELKEVLTRPVEQFDAQKFEILRRYADFKGHAAAHNVNQVDSDGFDLLAEEEEGEEVVEDDPELGKSQTENENEDPATAKLQEIDKESDSEDKDEANRQIGTSSSNQNIHQDNESQGKRVTNEYKDELVDTNLLTKIVDDHKIEDVINNTIDETQDDQVKKDQLQKKHRYNTRSSPHKNQESESDEELEETKDKTPKRVRFIDNLHVRTKF